ncbi:MAG: tetratricopeptide repeat protein [Verrucomicrobiae bacterium]
MITLLRKALLVACLVILGSARGWTQDASDRFLRAYQDFQNGEKLEREGNPREAFSRYQSAAKLLEQIVRSDPDWQPPVVEYRLKKTRENIARMEPEMAKVPLVSDGPEGALPQADSLPPPLPPAINTTRPLNPSRQAQPVAARPAATPAPPPGESAALRQQLAGARSENERLKEKLARQAAELQSARFEVDKTKISVVELKAQLSQAQDAMENAIRDREIKAAQAPPPEEKRLAEIQGKLLEIEADNEVLTEENQRLLAKLENAAKYIEASDAGRKTLDTDRKKIARQRDEAAARTKKIKDNTAAMERLAQEKEDLQNKFSREKEAAEKMAIAAKKVEATDAERLEKLSAENKALAARLESSEKKLAEAAKKPAESERMLSELRSEIHSLNDRLLEGQAQIASREDQVKALAKQLDESSGEVARLKLNPLPTTDEKRTLVENDLLRAIILRQIKEQAGRDAASGALEKEIQNLQIKSDVISQQIDVLRRPAFRLSDDEKLLFKEPIAMLSEANTSSLSVTLAVAKPAGGFPATPPVEGPESLPDDTRDMVDQARKLFGQGRFDEAEKLYQQIVASAPNNYFALSNLGVAQIQARKLSAAEVALKKAMEINPKDSFAATNLGVVYCKQGRFDEAIVSLEGAVASDAKDHIAENYLGICYGEKGRRQQAEDAFKRSIAIREEYPDAHFNLAVLYATGEPPSLDLAKEHYQIALQHGSDPDPSLEQLFQQPR